jgi:hypothetical protein
VFLKLGDGGPHTSSLRLYIYWVHNEIVPDGTSMLNLTLNTSLSTQEYRTLLESAETDWVMSKDHDRTAEEHLKLWHSIFKRAA